MHAEKYPAAPARFWEWTLLSTGLTTLLLFGIRTIATTDFWTRLAVGRHIVRDGIPRVDVLSYTQDGAVWRSVTWLYDALLYVMWSIGGAPLITLLHVAAALGAFAFLLPYARRFGGTSARAIALLLAAALLASRFEVQPALLGMLLAGFFLHVLTRPFPYRAALALLLPAQVLWTNLHSSFLLGPLLALLPCLRSQDPAGSPLSKRQSCTLAALLAAATLATPYGFLQHVLALRDLLSGHAAIYTLGASPMSDLFLLTGQHRLLYLALAIASIGLGGYKGALPRQPTALAVAAALLAVTHVGAREWFALLSLPFATLGLHTLGQFILRVAGSAESRLRQLSGPLLGTLALIWTLHVAIQVLSHSFYVRNASPARFGLGAEADAFPSRLTESLTGDLLPQPLVHSALDGGYLLWARPDRKVFTDNRPMVYSSEFAAEWVEAMHAGREGAAEKLVAKWNPEGILLNALSRGACLQARQILSKGGWQLAYFDGTSILLTRAGSPRAQELAFANLPRQQLERLDAERTRVAERIAAGGSQPLPSRLIGAGNFFMAMDRYAEAYSIYALLVKVAPTMIGGWFNLGVAAFQTGDLEQSVAAMETTVRQSKGNALAWAWLARALKASGDVPGSNAALQEARRLDAKSAEELAKAWKL